MSSLMAIRADAVQEALDNFPVLLLDLDAGRALHILGIGRLQFRRRARLLAENGPLNFPKIRKKLVSKLDSHL